MRWPLRLQILIPFAAVMLVAILSVSLLNAHLAATASQRHIEQQLQGVARTLMDSSFPLSDQVLKQMNGLSGADFILADPQGRTVAASRPIESPLPEALAGSSWRDMQLGRPIELSTGRFFHTALNLGQRAGQTSPETLHILYPEEVLAQTRRQAAFPSLAVGGVALLAVVLIAILLADRLSRPILSLRSHVGRLTQADFQPAPVPHRNDELQDLVLSVNKLAAQLDEMRTTIRRGERLALLGQLSGGLAHHLRNDVTGARMAVQLHQRQCNSDDQESLEVALRQLTLTEGHLKRLLTMGKPQELRPVTCNAVELLRDVLGLVEPSFKHRKVRLIEQFDCSAVTLVQADPDQIRHLLLNLLLNAAQAAGPDGWVRAEIQTSSANELILLVADSGSGPPQETLDHLFEPFTTSKPEGVGLGLAVARQIAKAHGGSLTYHRPGGVTCFELRLPSAATDSTSDADPDELRPTQPSRA